MFDKIKTAIGPLKGLVGLVVGALVLIWFWEPIWSFVIAVATKAKGLFH